MRLLEVEGAFAEIVFRQIGDAFPGHGAGEQAGLHGRVDDDSDVLSGAIRQNLFTDFGRDQGVRRLQRGDGGDFLCTHQLSNVEVGDADVANFALLLQLGHGAPALFDIFVGLRPVHLVEIDDIEFETAEAVFSFFQYGIAFETFHDFAIGVPDAFALGEDVRLWGNAVECFGHHFLGMAEAVDGGGIDPVQAPIERFTDGRDGIGIVLGTPAEGPTVATHGPSANAERGERKITISKLFGLHVNRIESHMAEPKVQNFSNHARVDPLFHFMILPVALITVLVAAYQLTQRQNLADAWFFILSIATLLAFLKIRTYSLKVQDRVIRLEETLRMERLLPAVLKERIGDLSEGQIVALRFASDAELAGLVEKTLTDGWNGKEIKKNIANWRPDFFRV
jgi:hypothetical protein